MKNLDNVGVTFVNTVLSRGAFNGNVNLTFGVFLFTPSLDNSTVDVDHVVGARLRMDMECAKNLHRELGILLDAIEAEGKTKNNEYPNPEPKAAPEPAKATKRVKVSH